MNKILPKFFFPNSVTSRFYRNSESFYRFQLKKIGKNNLSVSVLRIKRMLPMLTTNVFFASWHLFLPLRSKNTKLFLVQGQFKSTLTFDLE